MRAALGLLRRFLREHPAEAAREIERIAPDEAAAVLADEPPEAAAAVLERMASPAAARALAKIDAPSAAPLLCRLPPAVASLALRRLAVARRSTLVKACPEPWRTSLERACAAAPMTVGAWMDPAPPALPEDWTAEETRAHFRERPEETAYDLFVVDRGHRLLGRLDLRKLAALDAARRLGGVMHPQPGRLPARALTAAVRQDPLWRRFDVLPVTDENNLLVGSLAHRTLRSLDGALDQEDAPRAGAGLLEVAELIWTGWAAAADLLSVLGTAAGRPIAAADREVEPAP